MSLFSYIGRSSEDCRKTIDIECSISFDNGVHWSAKQRLCNLQSSKDQGAAINVICNDLALQEDSKIDSRK